ncbi:MAG: methylmalonyl-CoA mutase [Candidatus Lindowbacteria bacterium RIFCSPLOWO2_12_FULL_62_27]|nr:MAG: methylmalonyl-CoA mutase [Candidatus Lindowbacteria bacterium RIFCSPLOWO2_12_FULL_62_27]
MDFSKWRKDIYEPLIRKHAERRPAFATSSGIPVEPLYSPAAAENGVGFPGVYPYTRGIQASMYRGKLWTMRQYAGFGTAEASNARYKYLLSQGQTGLSVAFDLPTQLGMDSDDPLARGEVGKVGVAIDSIEDMERLLDGIPLDRVSVSMTINAPAAILWAMVIAVARRRGVALDQLNGTIQNDVLKEYIARGTYIFPPRPSLRIVTDIFEYGEKVVPNWNTISISGYHIREAGSTAAQEVGLTFANAVCYVESAIARGLDPDRFLPRVSFFWNAHNQFLEEVAKFRAARRLWAKLCRDRFKAKDPRSWMHRFHTQTGGSTLTAQQPLNNVARTTVQALAAVLGGTQSLHTNAYDEALCLPTETGATVALRTQQILAHESKAGDTVDPLGGSYCVEALTDRLEAEAEKIIKKVDEMGGAVAAIEAGYPQREIQRSAYAAQQALEKKEEIVVGVNEFKAGREPSMPVMKVDLKSERSQVKRLKAYRKKRDARAASGACDRLSRAAGGQDNLMTHIVTAVESGATVGEIAGAIKSVFGEAQHVRTV